MQMLVVNIRHWHTVNDRLQRDKEKIQSLINDSLSLHALELTRIARLKPLMSESEYLGLEKGLRLYMLRVEVIRLVHLCMYVYVNICMYMHG